MSMKAPLIAAALVLATCAPGAALGQDDAAAAADRFTRMQEMMDAFDAAHDPAERRALMHDHMTLMHEQMDELGGMMSGGMMGGGMMNGHGAMMHGDDESADLADMRSQMMMMRQMMMQMMGQQHMMMELDEPDDQDGDD